MTDRNALIRLAGDIGMGWWERVIMEFQEPA